MATALATVRNSARRGAGEVMDVIGRPPSRYMGCHLIFRVAGPVVGLYGVFGQRCRWRYVFFWIGHLAVT